MSDRDSPSAGVPGPARRSPRLPAPTAGVGGAHSTRSGDGGCFGRPIGADGACVRAPRPGICPGYPQTGRPGAAAPGPQRTAALCVRANGVAQRGAPVGSAGRQSSTGSGRPATLTGASRRYDTREPVARRVASVTATVPAVACDCTRQAMFTTLPVAMPWPPSAAPGSTTASPVAMPTRARSRWPCEKRRCRSAATICIPARTARKACRASAPEAPKTAITASPMYFSTMPPHRRMISATQRKYSVCTTCSVSGSKRAESSVNPAMSTKRTVIVRRSRRDPASAGYSRRSPQHAQYR